MPKIKHIAAVQMGYSFRSRLETSLNGNIAVIQMKDLQDDNTVSCEDLVHIELDDVKDHHLVQKDDLVFRSRGMLTNAAIIREYPGVAIVAAPLFRIRVATTDEILPEYLNWYISQRDAQVYLTSRAKGSAQKMITKQAIEDMEVVLPSLEQQQHIIELARLSAREQALLHRLAEKREQYISTKLMQFAKGE